MLSRLRQTYCREAAGFFLFASVISSAGALIMLATILSRLSTLQSFTPLGDSVPLAERFVKADDVQILVWAITGVKFQVLIALCLVVRALGQLSRSCIGVFVGHVALALATYEAVVWTGWHRSIVDTYMPGLDISPPLGDMLMGVILLFMLTSDLVLLIATVVRYVKSGQEGN